MKKSFGSESTVVRQERVREGKDNNVTEAYKKGTAKEETATAGKRKTEASSASRGGKTRARDERSKNKKAAGGALG